MNIYTIKWLHMDRYPLTAVVIAKDIDSALDLLIIRPENPHVTLIGYTLYGNDHPRIVAEESCE